jgi:hypothetical protein
MMKSHAQQGSTQLGKLVQNVLNLFEILVVKQQIALPYLVLHGLDSIQKWKSTEKLK